MVTIQTCVVCIITMFMGLYLAKAVKKGDVKLIRLILISAVLLLIAHGVTSFRSFQKKYEEEMKVLEVRSEELKEQFDEIMEKYQIEEKEIIRRD